MSELAFNPGTKAVPAQTVVYVKHNGTGKDENGKHIYLYNSIFQGSDYAWKMTCGAVADSSVPASCHA